MAVVDSASGTPGVTREELAQLSAPTLLVKGTLTAGWLRRVADILVEQLSNATILELQGDHACHIESIDHFLEALQTHLKTPV